MRGLLREGTRGGWATVVSGRLEDEESAMRLADAALEAVMQGAHAWLQTGFEYDDSFFECSICHAKTHQKRGTPAATKEECAKEGLEPCKPC
jgi:hypothetical protein